MCTSCCGALLLPSRKMTTRELLVLLLSFLAARGGFYAATDAKAALAPWRAYALLALTATRVRAQTQISQADAGLQALLAARGYAAGAFFSNAAAVVTTGAVAGVLDFSQNGMARTNLPGSQSAAALLVNGCIFDVMAQPLSGVPYLCVPAGLGSVFVSVMRTIEAVGGVTDTGAIVFFGDGVSSPVERCVYLIGPYTPMATVSVLYPVPVAAVYVTLGPTTTLCALTRAGSLECSTIVGGWWTAAGPTWKDWTAPSNATTPAASACRAMAGNNAYLTPSRALCPNTSPAVCAAPITLSSFSITTCSYSTTLIDYGNSYSQPGRGGTYITGVRLADSIPVGWLLGVDAFDASTLGVNTSAARGLFLSGAPAPAMPQFAPVLECAPAFGARGFVGLLRNGSFFRAPEVRDQGSGATALASQSLSADQAGLNTFNVISVIVSCAVRQVGAIIILGKFRPFSYSSVVNGPAGIRNDGSFIAGVQQRVCVHGIYQANILPQAPIAVKWFHIHVRVFLTGGHTLFPFSSARRFPRFSPLPHNLSQLLPHPP